MLCTMCDLRALSLQIDLRRADARHIWRDGISSGEYERTGSTPVPSALLFRLNAYIYIIIYLIIIAHAILDAW